MNITLIGYRGSGKSTIGRLLAERLDWRCIDTDQLITHHAKMTIKEIFEREGEPGFRDRETIAVREATTMTNTVIAAGGGAILLEVNRDAFRAAGRVIWLTAPASVLYERIEADASTSLGRPKLTSAGGLAEVEQLLERRLPLYRATADVTLDVTTIAIDEAARRIYKWWVELRRIGEASASGSAEATAEGRPPLPAI